MIIKRCSKIISILLIVSIVVSFVGVDYVQAKDSEDSSKIVAIGAAIVLSVWGITNLVKKHHQEKYQSYLSKGKIFLEEGDYRLAINNLEEAKSINDSAEVTELLYKAEANYKKKHYQLGSSYFEDKNWQLAYKEFEKVRRYDNSYLDVNQKYNRAYQKLRELKLKRIAVINFEDTTYRYELGSRATSLFSAQLLNKDPKFIEVVERDQINAILEEQKFSTSGLVDSTTAKELGSILGVDYLLVGKVLSGNVTEDRSYEYVEGWDGETEKRYEIEKEAYTQIIFKLLDVSTGTVVLSKNIKKKNRYSDSYYQGDTVIAPSDEEMIDDVLTRAVDEFAQMIYDKYEL